MSREVVTSLYFHNHLISLVMLEFQRKPLMLTVDEGRDIWEWRDHTRFRIASNSRARKVRGRMYYQ
jgi:hypothetical protein